MNDSASGTSASSMALVCTRVVRKCARDPQSLTPADYKTLFSHGYTQSQVVEIVSMSALAVYANIMADATAMENDEMFDRV